jgi:hypothetical protein
LPAAPEKPQPKTNALREGAEPDPIPSDDEIDAAIDWLARMLPPDDEA